jgi:hypothetical protein
MRLRNAALTLALAFAAWLAVVGPAAAKITHEREGSFPLSPAGFPFLAVDSSAGPSSGDLYIGEFDFGTEQSRVYQADSTGAPTGVELDGSETPAGSFGLLDFATFRIVDGPEVDSSAGAKAGDIYVPDVVHGVVDLFDESGSYVCQITGSATPSASECAGASGSETPAGGLEPLSVAVDPSDGDVAVGDARGVVYVFDEAGEFKAEIADSRVVQPGALAYDSAGSLYVVNGSPFTGPGDALKFSPAGSFEYVVASGKNPVAVDLSNDHVYLGVVPEGAIEEFDSSGTLLSSFGEGALSMAVDRSTNRVYVASVSGEGQIWSGDLVAPTTITEGPSDVDQTSATLNGHVDPEIPAGGTPVESCEFEYGEDETYGQSIPCSPAAPYSSATDVSASLTQLNPSTTYQYRLVTVNSDGREGRGENRTFTTFGPARIGGETAIARTTSATVSAQVNPFGYQTECEVQYVDEASFQASEYAQAVTAPCAEVLAAGFGDRTATATLEGLSVGETYHYRFVATSQGGTRFGADQTFSTFGIESFSIETLDEEGQPYTQAGGHPYALRVIISLTTTAAETERNPASVTANLRSAEVQLPPGLIGNPTAAPKCAPSLMKPNECPAAAQVGLATVSSARGTSEFGPVYNLAPPTGVAAQLGARFNVFGTARIDAGIRTGSDYGVDADSLFVTADEGVQRVEMTLWGVPADEGHFSERFCRGEGLPGCAGEGPLLPFLTNPTSCSGPLTATLRADSWQAPGNFDSASSQLPAPTGCDLLKFEPTIAVRPQTRETESPTGLHVDLHLPQNQDPSKLAEANLEDVTVNLPDGLAVNPASANGLASCSPGQIDLHGPGPAACPDAAKIGTVEVDTPLLDHPLPGAVYVATPHDNPFGSLLAIYIAVYDPQSGVVVKLAGEVTADPSSGRLSATFSENPQLPFEDFKLDFFGGPDAALMSPQTCGRYTTTTEMTPWSENGDAHPSDSFLFDSGPNGSACVTEASQAPNSPAFSAGTVKPRAGAYSPFVLHLSRPDGSQRLRGVSATLPPGLLARLAGVPYCPQSALDAAAGRSGREEQSAPSCPAASQLGSVDVGVGAGPQPYHVAGRAYLAGPYKGAPVSMAIVTPAVAGPYDLGTVVVRTALYVDPAQAQVHAVSDPIPTILQGIPLDLRSIALSLDRPSFTLNPTNCEPMAVTGSAISVFDQAAALSNRFQVGGCRSLRFAPRLHTRLFGATGRGANPRLRALLTAKPRQANIARTAVRLPHSEFLDQAHIRTVCTRVQFAADSCPKGSVYGSAKAWTPLLDRPLSGPVYLRSNGGERKLPDLVAALRGPVSQPIEIDLVGFIDSIHGGIRTRFETIPDAPVSKFMLTMKGGAKGLLVNSTNLCTVEARAVVKMRGQNGRAKDFRTPLRDGCGKRRGHR